MTPAEIDELVAENAALVADRERLLAQVSQLTAARDALQLQLGNALVEIDYYRMTAADTAATNHRLRDRLMAANDEVRRTRREAPQLTD